MSLHFEEEVVQLERTGLAIEWVANTAIESSKRDGTVSIIQDGEEVVIPWCYIRDVIKALEEANSELKRYRDCGLGRNAG